MTTFLSLSHSFFPLPTFPPLLSLSFHFLNFMTSLVFVLPEAWLDYLERCLPVFPECCMLTCFLFPYNPFLTIREFLSSKQIHRSHALNHSRVCFLKLTIIFSREWVTHGQWPYWWTCEFQKEKKTIMMKLNIIVDGKYYSHKW